MITLIVMCDGILHTARVDNMEVFYTEVAKIIYNATKDKKPRDDMKDPSNVRLNKQVDAIINCINNSSFVRIRCDVRYYPDEKEISPVKLSLIHPLLKSALTHLVKYPYGE